MSAGDPASAALPVAAEVFGGRLDTATRFVELLAEHGVERGLIGPRELDRLWERHILNSAVVGELIPDRVRVVDVGSGAGFPGIPLAIARLDLDVVLVEPMARRVAWLKEVVAELGLPTTVVRGRAEEPHIVRELTGADSVLARAVSPLGRLANLCLPLVRVGGELLALKGASAPEEIDRDRLAVRSAGGAEPTVVEVGASALDTPTTVVRITRESIQEGSVRSSPVRHHSRGRKRGGRR